MIDVSIILVSYNTKVLTLQCIDSILHNVPSTLSYEIIVVDNASVDNSMEAVKLKFPTVKIVVNNVNMGFGYANNIGVGVSSDAKYLLFLNTDTVLTSDIFTPIIKLFTVRPEISCVSPFIVYPTKEPQSTYGVFPSITSFVFSFFKLNLVFRKYWFENLCYYNSERMSVITEVDQVVGVAMFIRKSVFLDVCGFDTDYFLYFEETDLCYRVKQKGGRIFVYPFVEVIHLLNKSMPSSLFKMKNMEKSRMIYFKKNSQSGWKWSVLISFLKHLIWGIKHWNLWETIEIFHQSYKQVKSL